jgi:hypothetical protein
VLLGAAGFALALERLIPRRSSRVLRPVAAPVAKEPVAKEPAVAAVSEPALPALEVPTMTFGAQVEEAVNGEKKKPAPRPRKRASNGSGSSNGSSSAPGRRRAGSSSRVAPSTDDAN